MPQDTGASNWKYWWDQLLQGGKNPLGSSGMNVENALGRYTGGGTNGRVDPRLSQFGDMEFVGSEAGSDMGQFKPRNERLDPRGQIKGGWVQLGDLTKHDGRVIDYSLLKWDPEFGIISPASNVRQDTKQGDITFALGALGLGAMVGPAIAAGAGSGAGGAGLTAFETLPTLSMPETVAMGADFVPGGAAAGAGAAGGAGGGGLGDLGANAINYETLPNVPMQQSTAQMVGTGGLGSPSLLSQAGNYVANNPGTVGRAALGLASLGASHGGGGGSGGGGSGDAASIIEQMARVNRVDHDTPLGSRKWTQDANGQWKVTDTMDPTEQANFQNVQGMNSGITDMARARLAALLAAPPGQRADRPISFNGQMIGG